jgi:hypothetical protein
LKKQNIFESTDKMEAISFRTIINGGGKNKWKKGILHKSPTAEVWE